MVKGLLEDPVDRRLSAATLFGGHRRVPARLESGSEIVGEKVRLALDGPATRRFDPYQKCIEKISHVYLDLDHEGTASLEALENSDLVPRPNYVLDTSPGKFQVVWKVDGMTMAETEALNQAIVREFDGAPAATDSTRVLRLPGFANKKYEPDFYVQARTESTQTYHPAISGCSSTRRTLRGISKKK